MKRKILITVGHPNFSFNDKISAVAGFLNSISKILTETGYAVDKFPAPTSCDEVPQYAGRSPIDEPAVNGNMGTGKHSFLKSVLKKFSPRFYNSLVDFRNLVKIRFLYRALVLNPLPDITLEVISFGGYVGYMLKKKFHIPYIFIYDSPLKEQYCEMYGTSSYWMKIIESREETSVRNADAIICYSTVVIRYLENKYKIDAGKCHILPMINFNHLTAKEKAQPGNKELGIGFIGSFLKFHKTEILVSVFNELCRKHKNIKLYLIGYGENWDDIRELVLKSPFHDKIIMPGFVWGKDLEEFKQQIDIGVVPSHTWYSGPMKLFEYAALEIPIVAEDTPTIRELFKEHAEIMLFRSDNTGQALFSCLDALIENETLRQQLGNNALNALMQRYSEEIYRNFYSQVISSASTL